MRTPSAFLRQGGALLLVGTIPFLLLSCSDGGSSDGAGGMPGTAGAAVGGAGAAAVAGAPAGGQPVAGAPAGGAAAGTPGNGSGGASGGAGAGAPAAGSGGAAAGSAGTTAGSGGVAAGSGGVSGGSGGVAGISGGGVSGTGTGGVVAGGSGGGASSGAFKLTSPNHMDGAKFADKYTCENGGFNKSEMPALQWTDPPAGTKSFAITFIDVTLTKQAMPNRNGYHWVLYNVPADVRMLPEAMKAAQLPMGADQSRDFLGPCPNMELHDYEFTIYALDQPTITLTGADTQAQTADAEMKLEAMNLAKAKLTGNSDASL